LRASGEDNEHRVRPLLPGFASHSLHLKVFVLSLAFDGSFYSSDEPDLVFPAIDDSLREIMLGIRESKFAGARAHEFE
jgi:hypothetical protein